MLKQGILLGLTGNIACGKSTVAKLLSDRGALHIDADLMAHKTYAPATEGFDKIIKYFGKALLTNSGAIDRKALGALVFSDPVKMKQLTDIVWPLTAQLIQNRIEQSRKIKPEQPVVLEAAVLIEAGWHNMTDEVWFVTCARKLQLKRLMGRNHLSESEALQRITSQQSSPEKSVLNCRKIDNSGEIQDLEAKIDKLVPNLW